MAWWLVLLTLTGAALVLWAIGWATGEEVAGVLAVLSGVGAMFLVARMVLR